MAAEGEAQKDTNPAGGGGGGGGGGGDDALEAAEEAMQEVGGKESCQEPEGEESGDADREGKDGDAGKEEGGCKDLVLVEDSVLVEDPEEVSIDCSTSTSYHEEHPIVSTSERVDFTSSSTPSMCGKAQGNDMVSDDEMCDDNVILTFDDLCVIIKKAKLVIDKLKENCEHWKNEFLSSKSSHEELKKAYNNLSLINDNLSFFLDLHNFSNLIDISTCVTSPSTSSSNTLPINDDDMLDIPSCSNNIVYSSSTCETNILGETKSDVVYVIGGERAKRSRKKAPPRTRSKGNKLCYECHEYGHFGIECPKNGLEEFTPSCKSSSHSTTPMCLMAKGTRKVTCEVISDSDNDDDLLGSLNKNSMPKIAFLMYTIEEQNESLEKQEDMLIEKIKELKSLHVENDSLRESHDKLANALNKLKIDHACVLEKRNAMSIVDLEMPCPKCNYLSKDQSTISSLDDACATNSISCEASILKENVELRAQFELLTSNHGELQENHENLLSMHKNLIISHDELKLAHEAIITKVSSFEPHVDTSTTSTQNVILPCASPNNSSRHNVATSCDELLSLPCCSNDEASTSSSTFVDTNFVEENKELKAQVTNLKKDLEKCYEGKATLNKILSVQKSPSDKSGVGFNSNNKKLKNINKKGQDQVKYSANITCFKCKKEGHHVRSCPLKKKHLSEKQQGKRPQIQERPHPATSQIDKVDKTRRGSKICYTCREKGHMASSCPNGTFSNPPIVNDHYSLRKDKVGNVFGKFVGAQSGLKVKKTIWVAKPIVTNFLGPNLVGDHQAKT